MSDNLDSFLTLSSSRHQPSMLWAVLFVVSIHVGLLGISKHWNPATPKPKERQKVIVQTIRLDSPRSSSAQIRAAAPAPQFTAPSPKQQPVVELPKPVEQIPQAEVTAREDIPEKKLIEKEEPPVPQEKAAPVTPPPVKPSPAPSKKEKVKKSATTPAKPAATKKAAAKKPAPVKKPAETAKKPAKPETATTNPKPEIDKKKQQEKTEADNKKKQEKAEAVKKQQKDQAEADKKRQQELAEEKKRQQEIAAAEEAAHQKQQVLLSKAKENLAKMGETRDKISTSPTISLESTALPKELGTLQVDALPVDGPAGSGDWGTKEVSYSGEVASRLKKALKLPDYGAVKIKLTLDRTGKVVKVEIVQSESSKNKSYVESKIPTLLFPPFGQRFKDASENTFVITLQNDS